MRNIVILGAGFGGLRTALKLSKKLKNKKRYKIILIDKNSYQTYTPSLYEVATAYRGTKLRATATEKEFEENLAGYSCFKLRSITGKRENIEFIQSEVKDINLDAKAIITESGDSISYEYCVVALGAQNAFYGVKGADTCCHTLKTLPEALAIRHKVEAAFDKASEDNKEINLITIGAGLSGFEVVTEMAKHVKHLCAKVKSFDLSKVNIKLVEATDEILMGVPKVMKSAAQKRLKLLNIQTLTNTPVSQVEPDKITLKNGSQLLADVSVWAGGVEGRDLFKNINGLPLHEKTRQILVDDTLLVLGKENIFAIGDSSYFFSKEHNASVPATAHAAEEEADVVTENIYRKITGQRLMVYEAHFPGFVSSAGGKYAIASLYGVTFWGLLAWMVKRTIDLKYILSIYPFFEGLGIWFRELDLWTRND